MGKYNIFFIKEKKYRLILSNSIYDKIYNHLVSELILSKLDKYLIDSNVATRLNKGTSYARKLLDRYLIKLKSKKFYILKFDINSCVAMAEFTFPSFDFTITTSLLYNTPV